jgi:hypothetical protein
MVMLNKRNIAMVLMVIGALFFVMGCAEKSKELLAEDYKKMNNEDLLRYYYRLSDEIEKQEKQSGPQFGFGFGGFGSRGGAGVDRKSVV